MDRRAFLKAGLAGATVFSFGSRFWRALASHATPVVGPGPYGPLGGPDPNGLRLPAGFTGRVVARSGEMVSGTAYRWHFNPDGAATFPTEDGWIYVCNSEVVQYGGGAGAIRFAADGSIVDAYSILTRTSFNCAGGVTPWGTWLSCEEVDAGHVWECDPSGLLPGIPRPALGTFQHEAAVTDPQAPHRVYMTEDKSDGRFYRFTPAVDVRVPVAFPSPLLESGTLEGAAVAADGAVSWLPVPDPNPLTPLQVPTRHQVPDSTVFQRGEGAWFDTEARTVYFSTTTDWRIWAYHVDDEHIEVLFDGMQTPDGPLRKPDNLTVASSGDVLVCEDGDDMEIVIITPEGEVAPLVQIAGPAHDGSEVTGVTFDPSGKRLYLSSQRGFGAGITYEVTGPFRTERVV